MYYTGEIHIEKKYQAGSALNPAQPGEGSSKKQARRLKAGKFAA